MSVSGYKWILPLQPLFGKYLSHTNVIQVCCITQNLSAYSFTPIFSGTKLWFLVHLQNLSVDWLFIATVEKTVTVYNITSFSIRENSWANIWTPGSRHANFQELTTILGENLRRKALLSLVLWFTINWKSINISTTLNLGWSGGTHPRTAANTHFPSHVLPCLKLTRFHSFHRVCMHCSTHVYRLKILLSSR